jgi:hypothetical protein
MLVSAYMVSDTISENSAAGKLYDATFEVITALLLKIQVCRDVTPCHYLAVPNVSENRTVFKTSGTTYSTIQHHIQDNMNLSESSDNKIRTMAS